MKNVVHEISGSSSNGGSLTAELNHKILEIMRTAAWYKISQAECFISEKDSVLKESKKIYQEGLKEFENGHYTKAADKFYQAFEIANCLVKGEEYHFDEGEAFWANNSYLIVSGVIIFVVIIVGIIKFRRRKYDIDWK
jgi:hypothetical protein